MKILQAVLSPGFYGSERYCIELAIAQARAGHEVAVFAHDGGSDCVRQFKQAIAPTKTGRGSDQIRLAVIPGWTPAWLHRPLARRALKRFRPDIVHTHLNPAARRVGQVAQRLGIPHVATLHLHYEPREHGAYDGLIAVAAWQRAKIPPDFPGEVAVVWNWLPAGIREALARTIPAEVAALRGAWGADDGTIVFGSVGRLMPEKGMDGLVRAFRATFPLDDALARLVIVGAGPQRAEVQRLAANDPRIVLAGEQDDVALFYRAFDVYVSAARFEPFGLAILEAMAAGLPLVSTRTEGPREFATDPRILWAEPDDEAALSFRLREAAGRGRGRFDYDMSPFTPERALAAIEAFYRRVAARRQQISG